VERGQEAWLKPQSTCLASTKPEFTPQYQEKRSGKKMHSQHGSGTRREMASEVRRVGLGQTGQSLLLLWGGMVRVSGRFYNRVESSSIFSSSFF
jgi:hypothetical protein